MLKDANTTAGIIKNLAINAYNASMPTGLYYGTVTKIDPLEIEIDQKLVLSEKQLILSTLVRDFNVDMTVNHTTENYDLTHNHNVTVISRDGDSVTIHDTDGNHTHEYKGTKTFTTHLKLAIGEKVILLRVQGGQKFLVVDRVRLEDVIIDNDSSSDSNTGNSGSSSGGSGSNNKPGTFEPTITPDLIVNVLSTLSVEEKKEIGLTKIDNTCANDNCTWSSQQIVNAIDEKTCDFATKSELDAEMVSRIATDTALQTQINNKVDKVEGKELSSNDFSNVYKEKLENLENYDDTEIKNQLNQEIKDRKQADTEIQNSIETTVNNAIAEIVSNSPENLDTLKEIADWIGGHENSVSAMNSSIQTNKDNLSKEITDRENADDELRNLIDNKVDKVNGKGLSTNDYTTAEKNKLAGLNNYDDTEVKNQLSEKAEKTHTHTNYALKTDLEGLAVSGHTHNYLYNHNSLCTMVKLGFTANADVNIFDFWDKLTKYVSTNHGFMRIHWLTAEHAYVVDKNGNKVLIDGGFLFYKYTGSPYSSWNEFSALYVSIDNNCYIMNATVIDNAKQNASLIQEIGWNKTQKNINSVLGLTKSEYGGTSFRAKGNAYQKLDLSNLDLDKFYPVIIRGIYNSQFDFCDVKISSPSYGGESLYNQNRIHFSISSAGWADTPRALTIYEYELYDNAEINIGCIGMGNRSCYFKCVWLRGGLKYDTWTNNCYLELKTADFTSSESVFSIGSNYYGGTNDYVQIMFTPQETMKQGMYSSRGFTGNLTGTATKATADKNGNQIDTTYATKEELDEVKKNCEELLDENEELIATNTSLQNTITSKNSTISTLQTNLSAMTSDRDSWKSKYENHSCNHSNCVSKSTYDSLKKQYDELSESYASDIPYLQNQLSEKLTLITELYDEIETLEADRDSWKSKYEGHSCNHSNCVSKSTYDSLNSKYNAQVTTCNNLHVSKSSYNALQRAFDEYKASHP